MTLYRSLSTANRWIVTKRTSSDQPVELLDLKET